MRATLNAFLTPTDDPDEADALAARGSEATAGDDLEHVVDRRASAGVLGPSAARHPSEGRE